MAKQLVIETLRGDNIDITISYPRMLPNSLMSKKEREEVKIGNQTFYWIQVPNLFPVDEVKPIKVEKEALCTRNWKEAKIKHYALIKEKRERLLKYQQMIEKEEDVWGDETDLRSVVNLLEHEARRPKMLPLSKKQAIQPQKYIEVEDTIIKRSLPNPKYL